jgi:NADPH-dependent 2,4-dienoyl-CoA reductase/sulfur reductase-like enzyme
MGCSSSVHNFNKKLVIVGASFAGLAIAEALWDYFNVVIIDKNDYY